MLSLADAKVERVPEEGFPVNLSYAVRYEPRGVLLALFVRDRYGLGETLRWPRLPKLEPTVETVTSPISDLAVSMEWEQWWELVTSTVQGDRADLSIAGFEELARLVESSRTSAEAWIEARRGEIKKLRAERTNPLGSPEGIDPTSTATFRRVFSGVRSSAPLRKELTFLVLPLAGEFAMWTSATSAIVGRGLFFERASFEEWLTAEFPSSSRGPVVE